MIRLKRATKERKRDRKTQRAVLLIGKRPIHMTPEEVIRLALDIRHYLNNLKRWGG